MLSAFYEMNKEFHQHIGKKSDSTYNRCRFSYSTQTLSLLRLTLFGVYETRELIIGCFRLDYEYEIEYEYDFSILVFGLHIITTHTHLIP